MARLDPLDLLERSWWLLKPLTALHAWVYRASGGRVGGRLPTLPQMLVLEHVGRRTKAVHRTPLLYLRDGDNLVVIASKGGHRRHPAWYLNLEANPQATAEVQGERLAVRARPASEGERERLWRSAVALYPAFESYRRHAGREIPIVVLTRDQR